MHSGTGQIALNTENLTDGFWTPRLRINREVTLPTQHQLLESTGRIDNFRATAGKNPTEYGQSELDRFVRTGAYYK